MSTADKLERALDALTNESEQGLAPEDSLDAVTEIERLLIGMNGKRIDGDQRKRIKSLYALVCSKMQARHVELRDDIARVQNAQTLMGSVSLKGSESDLGISCDISG